MRFNSEVMEKLVIILGNAYVCRIWNSQMVSPHCYVPPHNRTGKIPFTYIYHKLVHKYPDSLNYNGQFLGRS